MGIFDRFPYSSTHEMNLDFMLGKATEIAEDMQTVATGMAQVQAGLSAISEKTEQATQAAAQAAQSASSIEGSVTAAEEAAEEAQMHNESAQTWANNAMTYKADCQRSATEAAASSASAAQAATAAAASEDTVATYAQAANASAQSAANNNDSAHQYANQASASASNATFHSSNAQTAATSAETAATNAAASANRAETLVESLPEDFTDLNNTVNSLSDDIDGLTAATTTDIGKALSPKTVSNGKVTEWQYKSIGGGSGGGAVDDVQINGQSIVDGNGIANIPVGSGKLGTVWIANNQGYGLKINSTNGIVQLVPATSEEIKEGTKIINPIDPSCQHESTFYGLAKAAGDITQKTSLNSVGAYTESAKSAIHTMLSGSVTISGTTPTITAMDGIRYVCGEVSTLDITLPNTGIIDVLFNSGSTATILTITTPTGTTIKWANGFDPTALEANTTYEINIADGLGVACAWS